MPITSQIKQREFDKNITGLHASPLLNRIYAARGINNSQQLDLAIQHMLEPCGLIAYRASSKFIVVGHS